MDLYILVIIYCKGEVIMQKFSLKPTMIVPDDYQEDLTYLLEFTREYMKVEVSYLDAYLLWQSISSIESTDWITPYIYEHDQLIRLLKYYMDDLGYIN